MKKDYEDYGPQPWPPVCPECGSQMGWDSDFMASDCGVLPEDTPLEDDVVCAYFSCHCGITALFKHIDPDDSGNYLELVEAHNYTDDE